MLTSHRFIRLLIAGLLLVVGTTPAVASHSFDDVPDDHVFHADIAWLAVEEVTAGCNPPINDNYCPNDNVTRGQMAAFLVRALGLTDDGGGNTFVDDDGSIFEDDIAKLAAAGITRGCNPPDNTRFCPDDDVTRGQMAAFLVRALDLPAYGGADVFVDDNGSVFEDDIERLAAQGITRGCNPPVNDSFCPDDPVTRGQMAAFLNRAFNKPPAMVLDVIATLGGGSGELVVSWTANTETDVAGYNVWYSFEPGNTKVLLTEFFSGPTALPPDRIEVTDYPRSLISGKDCYQISAVDAGGLEGPRSAEACFDSTPGAPSQVTGVVATTAGGSGEIAVYWSEVPEPDVNDYNVWYSELPGESKTLITDPYVGPEPTSGNRWYIIDWPRSLVVGQDCYQISAVDLSGNEGPRSAEACFDPFP